jgi:cellulose synthase/poly-beta-1,6-N-acetylglucosamine synthase-like glycosyltransferase
MNISYAITVCNEIEEIKKLIPFLLKYKRQEDQICVLLDKPKASNALIDLLYKFSSNDQILLKESNFQGHFANWKNELSRMCNGNYIFNIDADEIPSETLIKYLPEILENNPDIKAYAIPRVNTVEGLTQEHIHKWRWNVNEKGWVNYPDYQIRIYKNTSDIFWEDKVHESLNIRNEVVPLPMETEDWVLYHPKTIERQEKQNNYYSTL